jgi:hypothetical protein
VNGKWFTPNEIDSILKANAASGVRWKEIVERVVWETSNGKLEAINRFGQLQVSTKEYADYGFQSPPPGCVFRPGIRI